MLSTRENNIRFVLIIIIIFLSLAFANESEENDKLFGASLDLGYVGPNVWAGWQLSQGPCIQPVVSFSIWEFSLGIFWNLYGSEKDRAMDSQTGEGLYGKYKSGFGMCDEVQFFAEWGHTWKWFSLSAAYWHLAYTWGYSDYQDTTKNKPICEWFGTYSSGELTLTPSLNLGPFSIFTEQNMVIIANERDEGKTTDSSNIIIKRSDLGSYHGVFGVTWAKESDMVSVDITAKTEWATWKFIRPWIGSYTMKQKRPSGFYHITLGTGASYTLFPSFSISGNFNVQFTTNRWIKIDNRGNKGIIPYGGIHLTYNWSW